ncbi:MAG: CrcB family protein [Candidatus Hydrogenedentota bacterium]
MLLNLMLIAVAGGLGAVARYGTGLLVIRFVPEENFPWATFTVNMVGCLLFGIVFAAIEAATHWDPCTLARARMVLLTGFMGAFTTYSTYAFQSVLLIQDAKWGLAVGNIAGQTVIGLLAIFAGLYVGKAVF